MELKMVRVKKRSLTCRTCETEFFGYTEAKAEEGHQPPNLFECDDCGAIFSISAEESEAVAERIQGKTCPDCVAPLEETLVEKTQAGSCPMCEDRDYYGTGDSEDVDLESYCL